MERKKTKKVYCRIANDENNPNKWGYVRVDRIRRASDGGYRARVHLLSEEKSYFGVDGIGWFRFKKSSYENYNRIPVVPKGETISFD